MWGWGRDPSHGPRRAPEWTRAGGSGTRPAGVFRGDASAAADFLLLEEGARANFLDRLSWQQQPRDRDGWGAFEALPAVLLTLVSARRPQLACAPALPRPGCRGGVSTALTWGRGPEKQGCTRSLSPRSGAVTGGTTLGKQKARGSREVTLRTGPPPPCRLGPLPCP